ncbi:MAG: hypothetical protein R6U95_07595, partial [Bacteroidales bacterium]
MKPPKVMNNLKYTFFLLILSCTTVIGQVPVHINSGDPNFPFPQFLDYGTERKTLASVNSPGVPHAEMEQRIRDAWRMVCNNVAEYPEATVGGVQYLYPIAPNHCTCVEGDGYYLIGAAIMGDKTFFDGYYMWAHDRSFQGVQRFIDGEFNSPDYAYSKGLSGAGSFGAGIDVYGGGINGNSATDGDVDIAIALLMAYKQWGEHSGIFIPSMGNKELNYKEEALRYIRAMVKPEIYPLALPEIKYTSGIVGFDGYLKGGDSQGELTEWASGGYNGMERQVGQQNYYYDYSAPAWFRQFRLFIEDEFDKTMFNDSDEQIQFYIDQYKRVEASCDWLMGLHYSKNERNIPYLGKVIYTGSDTDFDFDNYIPDGEDFRASWRTIMNYIWHGDPSYTWDPISHQVDDNISNTYESDMGKRYAKFLAKPQSEPWNNPCRNIGDLKDNLTFNGPYTLLNGYTPDGEELGAFPLNWIHGTGAASAIVGQDFELMGEMFRHCVIAWDGIGYLDSQPTYFHEFFKLLGMLTLSGNYHSPENMIAKPNLKVYHKIDKTYAFAGDEVTYTISYRNYGSEDALNSVVKFGIPNDFSLVSATHGGTQVGDSIVWNIGTIKGFKTGELAATMDSLVLVLKISDNIKNARLCTNASISCSNGFGWISNEYPNNQTAVMERNCVDVVAKALQISKKADRLKTNVGNTVKFTIDFENSTEAGWINGGRPGVNFSFAHEPPATPSSAASVKFMYRLFHDAAEPYIDYGNYRVSYYMYDPSLTCFTGTPDCATGWTMTSEYYQGGDAASLNISHEQTVEGSDGEKKWNQRMIVQFAPQLATITQHLQQYSGSPAMVHEGGTASLRLNMRMETSNYQNTNWSDDWSWDDAWSDDEDGLFFPITDDHTNPNNLGIPVNSWHKSSCETSTKTVDRILVEEWDGYTWRRILGNGPMPGRDVYNVVLQDTLPFGLSFENFLGSCPLAEYGGEWTTSVTPDGRDIITWTIDRMMVKQKGTITYTATTSFPSGKLCQTPDEDVLNKVWIWGDKESPTNDTAKIVVTCAELPTVIQPTTLIKTADKESYNINDNITYTLEYEQTHGNIANNALDNPADWSLSNWVIESDTLSSVNNNSGTATFDYAYGQNGYLEFTCLPAVYAEFQTQFRIGSGNTISLSLKPLTTSEIEVTCYVNNTEVSATETLIYSGGNPFTMKIDLYEDLLRLWINKDTINGPNYSVNNLPIGVGETGFKNGNTSGGGAHGVHKITNIHTHFDYAYDLVITDPIPSDINFISADNNGTNNAGTITWDLDAGPIPFGTKYTLTWTGEVVSCGDYIENIAYANMKGIEVNSIAGQTVVDCGTSECPEPPTVTSPVRYCQGDEASALSATGTDLLWYADTTGSGSSSAPVPQTDTAGSISYFVSQTENGCESDWAEIEVIVKPSPPAPGLSSNSPVCV